MYFSTAIQWVDNSLETEVVGLTLDAGTHMMNIIHIIKRHTLAHMHNYNLSTPTHSPQPTAYHIQTC
jgi:hypothetical protein